MFWFGLPLEWSCLRTPSAAALMSRGIAGYTQPAWTILEDRSEWDHFRQCEQPPDTGHSYMILKLSFRNSSVPSAPKFCTICLYCQGSDRILHLIQLEKLLPLRHQWAKKKKIPKSLYQESSQRAGGWAFNQCSQKHSPAPAGTSVPWLFSCYKLASFSWSGSALNITAGQCLLSFQIGLNIFKKDLGSTYCLRQLLVNSSCLLLFPSGNASEL